MPYLIYVQRVSNILCNWVLLVSSPILRKAIVFFHPRVHQKHFIKAKHQGAVGAAETRFKSLKKQELAQIILNLLHLRCLFL